MTSIANCKFRFALVHLWSEKCTPVVPVEKIVKFNAEKFNAGKEPRKYSVSWNNRFVDGYVLAVAEHANTLLQNEGSSRPRYRTKKTVKSATDSSAEEGQSNAKRKKTCRNSKGVSSVEAIKDQLQKRMDTLKNKVSVTGIQEKEERLHAYNKFGVRKEGNSPELEKGILEDELSDALEIETMQIDFDDLDKQVKENGSLENEKEKSTEPLQSEPSQLLSIDISQHIQENEIINTENMLKDISTDSLESINQCYDHESVHQPIKENTTLETDQSISNSTLTDSLDESLSSLIDYDNLNEHGSPERTKSLETKECTIEAEETYPLESSDNATEEVAIDGNSVSNNNKEEKEMVSFKSIIMGSSQQCSNRKDISEWKKKSKDQAFLIKKLQKIIEMKDKEIANQRKEIQEIQKLNYQHQHIVVNGVQEFREVLRDRCIEMNGVETDLTTKVGRLSSDRKQMHMGRGVYIDLLTYSRCVSKCTSRAHFVKLLASIKFDKDVLLRSTVYGHNSNRSKQNKTNEPDALDRKLLLAIQDTYSYYLQVEESLSLNEADFEAIKTMSYISQYIGHLKGNKSAKKPKKSAAGKLLGQNTESTEVQDENTNDSGIHVDENSMPNNEEIDADLL